MVLRTRVLPIALALLLVAATGACSAPAKQPASTNSRGTVTVAVTRDFGRQILVEQQVPIGADTSAMEALKRVADVETSYGGGFVQAIDGLRSTYTGGATKDDWFYSINGINARVGALDYRLQAGEVEHFDYHNWGYNMYAPAIIGAFPEPFLHGYGGQSYPTIVVYDAPFKQEAALVHNKLVEAGVKNVSVIASSASLAQAQKEGCNIIVLGLSDNPLIAEMNQVYKKLGLFACFQDGKLEVLNAQGRVQAEYRQGAGVLQATQSPWNPNGVGAAQNVAWIVSGTDETGVKLAAQALTERSSDLRYAFAAVVTAAGMTRVPQ